MYQSPDGVNLGERLDYKLVLRESERKSKSGRGGPSHLNNAVSETFPVSLLFIARLTIVSVLGQVVKANVPS